MKLCDEISQSTFCLATESDVVGGGVSLATARVFLACGVYRKAIIAGVLVLVQCLESNWADDFPLIPK